MVVPWSQAGARGLFCLKHFISIFGNPALFQRHRKGDVETLTQMTSDNVSFPKRRIRSQMHVHQQKGLRAPAELCMQLARTNCSAHTGTCGAHTGTYVHL